MKTCNGCGLEQKISNFQKHSSTKDGLRVKCRQCCTIDVRNWRNTGKTSSSELDGKGYKFLISKVEELKKQFEKYGKVLKIIDK